MMTNADNRIQVIWDLAEEVVAVADLDADIRNDAELLMFVGEAPIAIWDAAVYARSPLPDDLVRKIRSCIAAGWFGDRMRAEIAAGLDRHAADGSE